MMLASGRGHKTGGAVRSPGGVGIGIGIGIGIGLSHGIGRPVRAAPQQKPGLTGTVYEGEPEETERAERTVKKAGAPARKLAAPRITYLLELAMDIDKTLAALALSEPVQTVQRYKNLASQARKRGDLQSEKEAVTSIGHVYYLTGWFSRALDNYAQLLEIARRLNDSREEAVALRNLSATYIAAGDYRNAEQAGVKAAVMFLETGNAQGAQMTLNNLGVLEKNRGRIEKARESFEQAREASGDQNRFLALSLSNMAKLHLLKGEHKSALDQFRLALEVAKKLGDPNLQTEILMNIGQVYADWGQYDKALESTKVAADTLEKAGVPADWPKKVIGDMYLLMGKSTEAEPYVKAAEYDSSLGLLYLLKSDPETARKHYEQLLNASQNADNPDELFTAYTGLGKAYEATKNYSKAESFYTKGLEVTEEIRSKLLLSERKNFFEQKINGFARSEPAKGLVRVTLKQKKAAQSIFPSEAARAREFADNISLRVDGSNFNVREDILAKELEVTSKLAALKSGRSVIPRSLDNERFNDLTKQIKAAESERNAFIQSLWKENKEYASVKYPKPVKLEEAGLGPKEHVIVYDVLGDGVGIRVLQGKKVIDSFYVDWGGNQLEKDIANFRKPFESARLGAFDPDLAAGLYRKLLADPLKRIPKGTPVTILPDGILALLPFEALVVEGKVEWIQGKGGNHPSGLTYAGDLYPMAYYQSLTAAGLVRSLSKTTVPNDRLLVVADPVFEMRDARLQGTKPEIRVTEKERQRQVALMAAMEEESGGCFRLNRLPATGTLARDLENLYSGTCDVYTGLDSTKGLFFRNVAPNLSRYGAIVFATHGFAGNNIPGLMEPALALTTVPPGVDGFLTMSEVVGLKMNTNVTALTACQTGVGVKLAGEGIMSMGRAFQCAGSKSVVMSLWSVEEDSSVALMNEFFKRLKAGDTKMQAWNSARGAIRKAGYGHPFFWGAFVLVGEIN
jgi:CHAT domain-containing protein